MTPENNQGLYQWLSTAMMEQYVASVTATVMFMLDNAKNKLPPELSYLFGQAVKASLQGKPLDPATAASLYQACQLYDGKMGLASSVYHISSTLYALPSTGLIYILVDARNRIKKDEVIKYIDENMQLSDKIRQGRSDGRIMLDLAATNTLSVAKVVGNTGLYAAKTLAEQAYKISTSASQPKAKSPGSKTSSTRNGGNKGRKA